MRVLPLFLTASAVAILNMFALGALAQNSTATDSSTASSLSGSNSGTAAPTTTAASATTTTATTTTQSSSPSSATPSSTALPYICGSSQCEAGQLCFLDASGVICQANTTVGCYLRYEPVQFGGHTIYAPPQIPNAVYDGQFWEWNGPFDDIGHSCTRCVVPANTSSLLFYSVQQKMVQELWYGGSCSFGWCGTDNSCHSPVSHYHQCDEEIQCGFGDPIQGHNVSMACLPHDNSTNHYCVYDPNDIAFSTFNIVYPDSDGVIGAAALRVFLTFLIAGVILIFAGIALHLLCWGRRAARAQRTNQRVQLFLLNAAARRAEDQKDPAFVAAEEAARPVSWSAYVTAYSSRAEVFLALCLLLAGGILAIVAGSKAAPPWTDN